MLGISVPKSSLHRVAAPKVRFSGGVIKAGRTQSAQWINYAHFEMDRFQRPYLG